MRCNNLEKKKYTHKDLKPEGLCFVFIQLFDDKYEQALNNVEYSLKGQNTKTTINGKTDDQGILRHENIPDDFYVLESLGGKEVVEVYYMEEKTDYGDEPFALRMRGVTRETK